MLPEWVWGVLDLWEACRVPGPMGGTLRMNPCAGGVGDQPAALMDVFRMVDDLVAARQAKGAA